MSMVSDESEESKKQFEDTIRQTLGGLAQNADELQVRVIISYHV